MERGRKVRFRVVGPPHPDGSGYQWATRRGDRDCDGEAGQRSAARLDGTSQNKVKAHCSLMQTAHHDDLIDAAASQHARRWSGGWRRGLDGDGDGLCVAVDRPRPPVAGRAGASKPEARVLARPEVQLRGWFQ